MSITMQLVILGLALTILNAAVAGVFFFFIMPRQRKNYLDKLMAWRKVAQVAKQLIQESEVERFLVLMLTNGGGDPHPGANLYATALVNEVDDNNTHRNKDYSKVLVDSDYVQRIIQARAAGKRVMETEYMSDGILKNFYQAERVKYGELYYLFSTESETFYCSAASYSQTHLQGCQGDISLAVGTIRNVLSAVYPPVSSRRRWRK